MLGWLILLLWYVLYTVNSVIPIFTNSLLFLSHGITGVIGTLLIFCGYFFLKETKSQE
jgi:hypothetical protein